MKRAFTLIELLVVIAIIGILSSIVLASWNTAKCKADPKCVKTMHKTDCESYGNLSLKDMPAECITYWQNKIN